MVSRKIKFLIPKDRAELVPIFLTLFLICLYATFELSVILPTIYHNVFTYKEIFHLLFGCYIIFNLIGNLYICMITDTSVDTIICPVQLPSATIIGKTQPDHLYYYCNWHYCHQCEVNVPPRSQHCFICRKCILKHDHHCTFLGRCIGYRNIRYYMCFLAWVWIGLVYCNILHMDYTYELVGTLSWRVMIACLFPLGAWLFGLINHFSLFLSTICSTSIILNLYVLFLILQQLFLIINSQTWHEYKKNIHIYNLGKDFQSKLQGVFGRKWYLILFSPLIKSSPMGDGMVFDTNMIKTRDIQHTDTKRI
ncbi:unnamed protein product [Adineta steineri]|uniref:Palmitoyltransferase n=1 Tax=Adineta steineri TaxID=433720 RepID=A0A814PAS5_9BILA|nr:unnamed protein product [Adineta steineri]CAF3538227.1 unnamed protein product [Adineta steineri]